MHIACHIGAHSTDDDLLLSSLRQNPDAMARHGVLVPAGEAYRPILRETVRRLQGECSDPAGEDSVLEVITKGADPERLVLSSENFICTAQRVFEDGVFYGKIGQKMRWLRNVFPSHAVSFHIGLRSPASLVPALFARQKTPIAFDAYLAGFDFAALRWRAVVARLRDAVPDADVTVWCNEDTPLIWPEVMAALAGVPADTPLDHGHVRLREIITEEGYDRFLAYLDCHPTITVAQRRWAAISFLDRFADPARMQESYDLPGWTQDRIATLDAAYDADLDALGAMPGVRVLRP